MNDQKNILTLSPIQDLVYDIDEVDGPLYMFSHDCSGSVMLSLSDEAVKAGRIFLDGREVTDFVLADMIIYPYPVLCVRVRGILCEYDTTAKLHIEGFCGKNSGEMTPQDFTIRVLPHRESYPEEYSADDKIAFKAAAESMVLLKNDGILPLENGGMLNLFGRGVAEYRSCPVGAGRINPRGVRSLLQAVENDGSFTYNKQLADFYAVPNNDLPDGELLKEAQKRNDLAVVVITRGTGENIDNRPVKGEFYLSDEEEKLISGITERFEKTAVILNVGYPIDVRFLEKYKVNACIYSGYGGMFGADALIALLKGDCNPCGKLPDTWALDYYDIPASKNFLNFTDMPSLQTDSPFWSQICYEEGIYVGYRYFTSFSAECAFPFGYGLSYTSFTKSFSEVKYKNSELTLTSTVKNTGSFAGKQTLQLYISKPQTVDEQALYELVDFEKTRLLTPGQEELVEFCIPEKRFAAFDQNAAEWVISPGEYKIYSGESAAELTLIGSFEVPEKKLIQKVKNRMHCEIPFEEISRTKQNKPKGEFTGYFSEPFQRNERNAELSCKTDHFWTKKITFEDVKKDLSLAAAFAAQMSDYELCRFNICCNKSWNMDAKGEAGWTYSIEEYGLTPFSLADGNNGVNITKPNIGMPTSCMIAASFDKKLAYEAGCVIAREAKENNINILLGPAMNLHRNPLNGRGAEYFSEDPLLTGMLAGYQNKGFQDNGVSGCLKHLVANNCEAVRKRSNSVISERTLREIYLKIFEYALEIEPSDSIMTGYNAVNGCFCDEDSDLIGGILREEFGFDGFIMSDWNSYDTSDMIKMVNAGVSFLTPGSDDDKLVKPLLEALSNGKISRKRLESNIMYLIRKLAYRSSH